MKNYYKILGTDQTATTHEIKQVHKALLAKYGAKDAHEKGYTAERYIDIAIAYETLANMEKRTEYDRILNSILPPPIQEQAKQQKEPVVSPEVLIIPKSNNHSLRYGLYIGSLLVILTAITFIQVRKVQQPTTTAYVAQSKSAATNSIQQSLKDIQKQDKGIAVRSLKREQNTTSVVVPPVSTPVVPKALVKNSEVKRQEPMPKKMTTITPAQEEQTSVASSKPETTIPFTGNPQIGTTKTEVLKALGTPNAIVRYDNDNEIWRYSNKNIYFSSNKIISFNDVANKYPGESHYE